MSSSPDMSKTCCFSLLFPLYLFMSNILIDLVVFPFCELINTEDISALK